jgi:hypothetical protein
LSRDLERSEAMRDLEGATPFPSIAENSIELLIINHYKENTLQLAIKDYPVPLERPKGERPREER